ncbi:MAG: hypothetical protein RCG15_03710 [Candidatus Rickettsia vulgarisii]
MMLFGEYQFGAHRYFESQLVFGPEGCSTAVGKATGLNNQQIKVFNTSSIIKSYSKLDNEYGYKAITCLAGTIQNKQLELIQSGDILVFGGACHSYCRHKQQRPNHRF